MKKLLILALLLAISPALPGTAFAYCEKEFNAMQHALANSDMGERDPHYQELRKIWGRCLAATESTLRRRHAHMSAWDDYLMQLNRDIQEAWNNYFRHIKRPALPVPPGPYDRYPTKR